MRVLFLIFLISFNFGCICGLTDDGEDSSRQEIVCNEPYMRIGSECCLDRNQNSICDEDESSNQVVQEIPTTTPQPTVPASSIPQTTRVTTTNIQTTTSRISTTTSTTMHSAYECVGAAGFDKDSFILIYSPDCGGSTFVNHAQAASSDKGVGLTKIDLSKMNTQKISALECFLGRYYEGNANFWMCPRLMCPKTGKVEEITGLSRSPSIQMRSFAGKCS